MEVSNAVKETRNDTFIQEDRRLTVNQIAVTCKFKPNVISAVTLATNNLREPLTK